MVFLVLPYVFAGYEVIVSPQPANASSPGKHGDYRVLPYPAETINAPVQIKVPIGRHNMSFNVNVSVKAKGFSPNISVNLTNRSVQYVNSGLQAVNSSSTSVVVSEQAVIKAAVKEPNIMVVSDNRKMNAVDSGRMGLDAILDKVRFRIRMLVGR